MAEFASKGVANAGLATGIIGTGLSVLNGSLGNLFGGRNGGDETPVSRYEASQSARIAELETEVKLRDANTYTDKKMLELYQYVDGRLRGVEAQISTQSVVNAQITANISCIVSSPSAAPAAASSVLYHLSFGR